MQIQKLKTKRRSWLSLIACVLFLQATALTQTIQIGSGENNYGYYNNTLPIQNYDYGYSQQIVSATEYALGGGTAGNITKIRYLFTHPGYPNSAYGDWDVWIGHTTKTEFISDTDWEPITNLTQIFSGNIHSLAIPPYPNQWFEIEFTTPFNYNGTDNIVVAVHEKTPGFAAPGISIRVYNSTENSGLVYRSYSFNPDPANPPSTTADIARTGRLPQLQFEGQLASCQPISMPILSNKTHNSVDVAWTAGGTETTWDIQWGIGSFDPNSNTGTAIGSQSGLTTPSFPINGLTQFLEYKIYIRADCGSGNNSVWSPINYIALQAPESIPFSEDFSNPVWLFSNGTQTNKWYTGSATGNPANALYVSNSVDGSTNNYVTNKSSTVHAYKAVSFPLVTNTFDLQFDWKGMGEGEGTYAYDYMRVWLVPTDATFTPGTRISTTNTPGAIQVGEKFSMQNTWKTENFVIPNSVAGSNRNIVFEWENNSGMGTQPPAAVDNISINIITCVAPTNLTANNITDVSMNIQWTAGASETAWEIQWGTGTFNPSTNTGTAEGSQSNLNVPNYPITGLTQLTDYKIYVRTVCGGTDGESIWKLLNIKTLQIPVNIPFTDDFSSNNWVLNNGTQTNQWHIGSAIGNPANAMYISNDNGTTNEYTLNNASVVHAYKNITFPVSTQTFDLQFDWQGMGQMSGGGGTPLDYMRVWLVPATAILKPGTQISTTNTPGAIQIGGYFNNQSDWKTENLVIPNSVAGSNRLVVFEWKNNDAWGTQPPAAVDNVSITILPCTAPTDLTFTATSMTNVTLEWTSDGNLFNLEWGTAGFELGNGTQEIGLTTTSHPVTIITYENYEFYVRRNCGGGEYSDWAGPFAFKTGYCTPSFTSFATFGHINSFVTSDATILNIDNATNAKSTNGYGDFTAQQVITSGTSLNFTATFATTVGAGFAIWIDKNNNGVFEDSERVFHTTDKVTTATDDIDLTGIADGSYRMRIMSDIDVISPVNSCRTTASYGGEAEDYTLIITTLIPCVGTPDVSNINITTTPSEGNAGSSYNVEATGWPYDADLTYTWVKSTDEGTTWTNAAPSTNYYESLIGEIAPSNVDDKVLYRLRVACNADFDTSVNIGEFKTHKVYCTPSFSGSAYGYIKSFSTSDAVTDVINNSNAQSSGGYGDFTSTYTIEAIPNVPFNFSASFETSTGSGFAIWIDENNNGIFETTERVFHTTGKVISITDQVDITGIPSGTYRMRIMADYSLADPIDPCKTSTSGGEAEDYTLIILSLNECSGSPDVSNIDITVTPSEGNAGSNYNVIATGWPLESSLTFTWIKSTDNGTTWTNASTPTSNYTHLIGEIAPPNENDKVLYRLRLECGTDFDTSVHIGEFKTHKVYCTPEGLTTSQNYYISAITTENALIDLNYTASIGVGYANEFDTYSVTATPSSSFTVTINQNTNSGYFYAWADLNNNGTFGDTPEEIILTTTFLTTNATGTINIPIGFPSGEYRIRVANKYSGALTSPCGPSTNGNFVDFKLIVTSCDGYAGTVQDTSVCEGLTLVLTSSATNSTASWKSKDTDKATINATTGLLTGVEAGEAEIVYFLTNPQGCTDSTTAKVTVIAPFTVNITGYPSNDTLVSGQTYQYVSDGIDGTWESTQSFVATVVPASGLVTAKDVADTMSTFITYTETSVCLVNAQRQLTVIPKPKDTPTPPDSSGNNTGVADIELLSSVFVFPNPASDEVNVEFTLQNSANVILEIVDLNGKVLHTRTFVSLNNGLNKFNVNISDFASGIYSVILRSDHSLTTKKLVITR